MTASGAVTYFVLLGGALVAAIGLMFALRAVKLI
ncbi:cytochrome b6-f complex subunit 6 [Oxynema sp. CENA135]|uniref:Cytochrome b6-f complex subunit 6 n=1 Tax=Oxynema aestuarii AP17 TaxID=2064643 RepID=A0A6H1U3R6_9CYAN|nr:cytochrome b6-f complex subunit 6 [Oxynema sp. CENA135]QIZ73512.1 cytochrome b6-f complex subunit 6 [Oxynema aestuarii AP17]RMH77377.1 MAG: cytochrome b6-f complex subunit 6 [Cyanobacteria bacterium J007]